KGQPYFRENAEFHLEIAKATHNQVLLNCLAMIISGLRDVREPIDLAIPGTPEHDIRDHALILGAIRANRPERARRLMGSHLQSTIERLKPVSKRSSRSPGSGAKAKHAAD